MSAQPLKFYTSWFCPFAQRAWIALLHKKVHFEYIETDPYSKPAELLAINPLGLVPAIDYGGQHVYDSMVCIEYIDEAFPAAQDSHNILPADPIGRATARIWANYVNTRIVPVYYRLLQKREQSEREEAKRELLSQVRHLSNAMARLSPAGPFFAGDRFGLVDMALAPWVDRFFVLEHYRGFSVPASDAEEGAFARFHTWWDAVQSVPAFRDTVQDRKKLLESYQRYADDTARSLVAEATRKGRPLP